MESPIAKRPKMSEHEINEPTQTSSDTKKFKLPDGAGSIYENYYNQPYYIDKTLLIKELFKKTHVLITTPARFSKSLNMNMVKRFVEIEVDKDGKAIELDVDEDKHSSLWNRPGYNKEIFMKYLDRKKSKSLSEEELQSGLQILSKCLHGYYGKPVYVFIEELDRPLTEIIYGSRMT
ncbi:hypothetical protein PV326_008766, partial [Microctonus aethiopoides]